MNELNLYVCAVLIALGIVAHFGKRLLDLEQAGTILPPWTFIRQRPYTFFMAVISAYLLAAAFLFIGQLNYLTALCTGVLCNEAFDTLRARAAGRLQKFEDDGQNSGV